MDNMQPQPHMYYWQYPPHAAYYINSTQMTQNDEDPLQQSTHNSHTVRSPLISGQPNQMHPMQPLLHQTQPLFPMQQPMLYVNNPQSDQIIKLNDVIVRLQTIVDAMNVRLETIESIVYSASTQGNTVDDIESHNCATSTSSTINDDESTQARMGLDQQDFYKMRKHMATL